MGSLLRRHLPPRRGGGVQQLPHVGVARLHHPVRLLDGAVRQRQDVRPARRLGLRHGRLPDHRVEGAPAAPPGTGQVAERVPYFFLP